MNGIPLTKIVGYLRILKSAAKPAENDLAAQYSALRAWSETNGIDIASFVVEPYTGIATAFEKRSEGRKLFGKLGEGDIIVAEGFRRLFGTPEDGHRTLSKVIGLGFHFRSVDIEGGNLDLETSQMLLTVLLAVSANSSYPSVIRNRAVKKREGEAGQYRGGYKTFGWDIEGDKTLVPNDAEQAHIAELRGLRTNGWTYSKLEGYSADKGFSLTGPGIWKILSRLPEK